MGNGGSKYLLHRGNMEERREPGAKNLKKNANNKTQDLRMNNDIPEPINTTETDNEQIPEAKSQKF